MPPIAADAAIRLRFPTNVLGFESLRPSSTAARTYASLYPPQAALGNATRFSLASPVLISSSKTKTTTHGVVVCFGAASQI